MRKRIDYPIGSISSGTMRSADLIPAFCAELEYLAKSNKPNRTFGNVPAKTRKQHLALCAEIDARIEANGKDVDPSVDDNDEDYFDSENADYDLEALFDALDCYSAPYFYFGSHPGDGADYGFWLSESWDEDFVNAMHNGMPALRKPFPFEDRNISLRVSDLSEVPSWFRGEVAVVNGHGNVTLYVKTSRTLREIWSIV